jgi:hypothetical protein
MRKIVVEIVVPKDMQEGYEDVCAELLIEDLLCGRDGRSKAGFTVLSDSDPVGVESERDEEKRHYRDR